MHVGVSNLVEDIGDCWLSLSPRVMEVPVKTIVPSLKANNIS
jgi:hypothetical protein